MASELFIESSKQAIVLRVNFFSVDGQNPAVVGMGAKARVNSFGFSLAYQLLLPN